ncbi:VQ motif-containing protein 31-like [Amaranthus tricolor]|uniref:VQ motif-containing protein 31-like n=1 Tax=Amaranthus tricolor TaxID=29722 RepID=UPI00258A31AE|nr:VQ motif-containing protein 31-like [Amaranthus tricolor]
MEMPEKSRNPLITFVEADTMNFKNVVQQLTGIREETSVKGGNIGVKKPEFKLHERRQYKGKLEMIKAPMSSIKEGASGNRVIQTNPLNTSTKFLSSLCLGEPITAERNTQEEQEEQEEKAIKGRRFYLHPSPNTTSKTGFNEPELLNLFPLTSTSPKSGQESRISQENSECLPHRLNYSD